MLSNSERDEKRGEQSIMEAGKKAIFERAEPNVGE